jgi:glycerol-3-phosphate dehydrogenase (NAD(P)+)
MNKVCVIGSGKWGRAFCGLIKNATLISRSELDILKTKQFDIAFIALRTEAIESFLDTYQDYLPKKICSLSKGVFTLNTPFLSNKIEEMGIKFAILYGPNFADEVEGRRLSVSTVASNNVEFANEVKNLISTDFFKVETTNDIKAIEVYGIFKNIIAIFMGFAEQCKMPQNTKSAIFTKLIQEMMDFVISFGGTKDTFFTSAGIGDLFLTASSSKSRNFNFGMQFATNKKFIPENTVEGLRSLNAIYNFGFEFTYYKKLYEIFIEKKEINLLSILD